MHNIFFAQNIPQFVGEGYGYLYNWWAADDANMFPTDWRLPTSAEITTLIDFVKSDVPTLDPNYELRETSTDHWTDASGLDTYGFKLYGAGERLTTGVFTELKNYTAFWTSTEIDAANAEANLATFYFEGDSDPITSDKNQGYPIRPIYIGGGTPTSVTDDNGNNYPVVLIGTQYWPTRNWKATTLDNGNSIPNVTDNTAWSILSTLGRSAYDNDIANV